MAIGPGHSRLLPNVWYRKVQPVQQHMVFTWARGQQKPWYLTTNQPHLTAKVLSRILARRMTIEEYFRSTKGKRSRLTLRLIQIKDSQRLGRFLSILAIAYLLLVTLGMSQAFSGDAASPCV